MANEFDDITTETKRKVSQRSDRRAAAINAVLMAREHAGSSGAVSQADADVIMYITELLDKVAATS